MTKYVRISLSRQTCFCCDKHTFIATKDVFCHDKHVCWRLLWQKSYLWQRSRQWYIPTFFTRSMVSRFHWDFLPHIFSQHEKSPASNGCANYENVQRSTHSVEYEGEPHRESGPPSHPEQHKDDGDVDQRVGDIQPWTQQKKWGKPNTHNPFQFPYIIISLSSHLILYLLVYSSLCHMFSSQFQNFAAILILYASCHHHSTFCCCWKKCTNYLFLSVFSTVAIICFSGINGFGPAYLTQLLHVYNRSCTPFSSKTSMLKIRQYRHKTYGFRTFSYSGPHIWD